jgi:hypothetical protein
MMDETQGNMDFGDQFLPRDGYAAWQRQRLHAQAGTSQKLGLPLGHRVELRLLDGVVPSGTLRLKDDLLFPELEDLANVELAIGRTTFKRSDIESCVRLD